MATLSVTQKYAQYTITVDVTYSLTTSGATHTLAISNVAITSDGNDYIDRAYTKYTVKYGSATLINGETLTVWGRGRNAVTKSVTSNTTMTHSAQTKNLTLSLSKGTVDVHIPTSGGYDVYTYEPPAASTSATVSIAARPSYGVTYDANGGTGAPSAQTKWYGENLTLASGKPSRTNYVFKNWNTAANGSGTAYNPSATYSGNAALKLYAQWYAPYSVTYDANGGSGAPSAQVKVYNKTLALSGTRPTRAGYVFWHWNTNTSNTGTSYEPSANYTANANLSLHAIWNPLITYNGNGSGSSNIPATQTKTFGQNITLSSAVPTRTGYRFLSWNTKADGTGTTYNPSATYTPNVTLALYAIWKKVAQAPTISSISVVRCNASGTASDGGTYCKVTARWSVDTSADAGMASNQGRVTGTITAYGTSSSRAITFSSGTSGTSGTATALIPDCDTDTQYLVTVRVTNTVVGTGDSSVLLTDRSDILTMAFFTMDFAAGGRGVGIGVAAPTEGLEVGFDSQFDGDVQVFGDLSAPNLTLSSATGTNVFSTSGNWALTDASTYGYKYGPFVEVSLNVKTNVEIAAGTQSTVGTLTSAYQPTRAVGFANNYGSGYISGSTVYFRPSVKVSANTSMYIGVAYMKV